ncbi:MAG: UvrD-helicase domain-containing protein [Polyangiaceae bacterium]|nr:UvrD-helicase domain-containing protein [Polyangiaceae bacterium]
MVPGDGVDTHQLNPAQADAVRHVDGPLLVFAGAGSGKTRVITYRVANLVAHHHVAPYRVLAVTFTNKAAGEMRHRLDALAGPEIARDLWIGTFHAVCARLLRRYHADVGLAREFVIYDDADQRAVVARALKDLEVDERRFAPRQVLGQIHKEKQEGRTPADVEERGFEHHVLAKAFAAYEARLRAANACDFDDLLLHVMRLAESDGEAGRELRGRFSHVLVDEFQDTNQVQYRLVRALAAGTRNLCAVGDDDQSIYRWRGGDVRIIRGFRRDFPDAKVVKLEENYRSSARVLRAALAVIAPSREREPKELFTRNPDGEKLRVVLARDERDEAAFVCGEVKARLAAGKSPDDVAVFYRVHAQSRVLEEALRSEGIPYRIVGGTRFFDRAEIKDLLSYLRVLSNPRSDVDLLRVINVPPRGIGDTTVARLGEIARDRGVALFDALDVGRRAEALGAAPRKKVEAVFLLLDGLRRAAATLSPSELCARVLEESGYSRWLEAEDSAEGDARLGNLGELVGSMTEFEIEEQAAGREVSLASYLERVSLQTSADEGAAAGPKVSLMTVHAAKGLEFDTVLLTGMEERLFPYERADGESDLEEERRLGYVAVTRAKRRLVLTHTTFRTIFGDTRGGVPSAFLRDLPREDVEHVTTPQARGAGGGARLAPPSHASFAGGGARAWEGRAPTARRGPVFQREAPARPEPRREPGERWVERDPDAGDDAALARGARVRHPRFGEGTVRALEGGATPSATVHFPGWGERRILLRFLSIA